MTCSVIVIGYSAAFYPKRGVYTNNENPVAQCRAATIGLFPIGVARQGFSRSCKQTLKHFDH
jgi:hypothetical protein